MYEITFDIETTGLHPFKDMPIQIGAIVHKASGKGSDRTMPKEEFLVHINPGRLLPPIITKLTGLTDTILQTNGYAPSIAAKKWHDFIWKYQPATLIGYNCLNFDYPILHNFLATHMTGRFKHPPVWRVLDTMHMASSYFHTRKWLKLSGCAKQLKIPFEEELLHSALEDAILTQKCFTKILPSFIL